MSHNGYTNYETWAVSMYLDGNYDGEGTYHTVLELVQEASDNYAPGNVYEGIWTEDEARRYSVEDALKAWFEDQLPDLGASIAQDLLTSAVQEVNWLELAELKLNEIKENASA